METHCGAILVRGKGDLGQALREAHPSRMVARTGTVNAGGERGEERKEGVPGDVAVGEPEAAPLFVKAGKEQGRAFDLAAADAAEQEVDLKGGELVR